MQHKVIIFSESICKHYRKYSPMLHIGEYYCICVKSCVKDSALILNLF